VELPNGKEKIKTFEGQGVTWNHFTQRGQGRKCSLRWLRSKHLKELRRSAL
jgi:hypothetical protein